MRLDGWKSIAAYFGRERTTVIRWSTERGMPVHRIPGSARGSVYAHSEELDAWLAAADADDGAPAAPAAAGAGDTASAPGGVARYAQKKWLILLAAASGLALAVYAWPDARTPPPAIVVPQNDEAAALYVEARADWARRTPEALLSAIDKLKRVVAIEPQFAPAYSALADCYLLAREFGSLPDVEAFGRAQAAIDTALKINPDHAGALRARGFLDYWWHGDRAAASRAFRRSLAIDGKAAQTLFWFANALIDNGDFEEGMQRFAEAQLMEPGSAAIAADLAWARWSAGDTARAKAELAALGRTNPDLATISDYRSVFALADGDMPGFVREVEAMARLRAEQGLNDYAAELRSALNAGPHEAANRVIDHAVAEANAGDRRTHVWPAFVASAVGDRERLAQLLTRAEARGEIWGSAGLRARMAERWRGDAHIRKRLEDRAPPSLAAGNPR